MKRILKEPLVHFLLLGAALFGAYAVLNRNQPAAQNEILVSAGQIETLAATFTKVWQRPPTAQEMKGQIDQYVKEEMLSREAIALGLDRNDTVIRRRLQQKMEFLAEDFAAVAEPTDAELADYLAKHPEKFQQDARFTFRQVYLNPDQRGATIDADAADLLQQLRKGGARTEIDKIGDPLLLPQEFVQEPWAAVSGQFGREFADALEQVTPGEWTGPISSGYGKHLVFLSERTEARVPSLDEVRSRVERNLTTARREEAEQKLFNKLLERYTVTIQWPEDNPTSEAEGQTTAMHP